MNISPAILDPGEHMREAEMLRGADFFNAANCIPTKIHGTLREKMSPPSVSEHQVFRRGSLGHWIDRRKEFDSTGCDCAGHGVHIHVLEGMLLEYTTSLDDFVKKDDGDY